MNTIQSQAQVILKANSKCFSIKPIPSDSQSLVQVFIKAKTKCFSNPNPIGLNLTCHFLMDSSSTQSQCYSIVTYIQSKYGCLSKRKGLTTKLDANNGIQTNLFQCAFKI